MQASLLISVLTIPFAFPFSFLEAQFINGKSTTSFQKRPIVEPEDFLPLSKTKEAIIISDYGYNRIKQCRYFEDPYLSALSEEFVKYNKKYKIDHSIH